jgi:hypothetical protein
MTDDSACSVPGREPLGLSGGGTMVLGHRRRLPRPYAPSTGGEKGPEHGPWINWTWRNKGQMSITAVVLWKEETGRTRIV